jgi:SAM-dependent methyltransferase
MYRIDICQCCGSRDLDAYPAGVAPFITDYVLRGVHESSQLLVCRACSFRFYETRYTHEEAARLYGGYREAPYFEVRHRHEPWYTRAFNDSLGGLGGVEARRAEVEAWLDALRPGAETVLDYGGDRGQFLPVREGLERCVYDISRVKPEAGVVAFGSEAELGERTFDAVLVSQLLEHVSEVGRVLDHIRRLCAPGAALVVEVPAEHFDLRFVGRTPRYQRWIASILGTPGLATLTDLYSTVFRVKFGVIPPLGFARMHEHINYFDGASLRAALRVRGFEVVSVERTTTSSGLVWVALARAGTSLRRSANTPSSATSRTTAAHPRRADDAT